MHDRRFASLRGHSRSLLEDYEEDEDLLSSGHDPELDPVFGEPEHDGWSAIRPVYHRMHALFSSAHPDA